MSKKTLGEDIDITAISNSEMWKLFSYECKEKELLVNMSELESTFHAFKLGYEAAYKLLTCPPNQETTEDNSEDTCVSCGFKRSNHPFRHPFIKSAF